MHAGFYCTIQLEKYFLNITTMPSHTNLGIIHYNRIVSCVRD